MIQDRAYHWHVMTNVQSPPHHASRHCITDARPDQDALPPHPSTVAIPARPPLQTDARGPTSARKSHPRPHSSESPQTKTTVSASPFIWRSPSRWCRHGKGTCQCRQRHDTAKVRTLFCTTCNLSPRAPHDPHPRPPGPIPAD
jgi:hypothetical protein